MENKINFSPPSTREGKGVRFLLTTFSILLCSLQAVAQSLPRVAPEQVGMDSHRLLHADEAIHRAIDHKEIPGAVLAVIRHGKMAYLKAYGNKRIYPNVEPMEINTVFDMASCSKSMSTAVSVMILVERGQLRLLDRVSFYLPDFQEWRGENGEKKDIRIIDLMTHTSGLPPYAPMIPRFLMFFLFRRLLQFPPFSVRLLPTITISLGLMGVSVSNCRKRL